MRRQHTRLAAALMVALAGAAFTTCTSACERLAVTVLPLDEPSIEVIPMAELAQRTGITALATFGGMQVDKAVGSRGCSVTLGYVNPVIYIAQEVAGDACTREHVLTHEREHVAIYRRHLATLTERMQAHLNAPDLKASALAELEAVRAQHAAHDSPAEYATNRTACGGLLARHFR